MKKIIELDDFFPTGEPTVQTVLSWNNGRSVDTSRITKYASDALDYIKNVAPEPGKTSLLLNALGAEETYGPNRNGDGFPEFPIPARGKLASVDRQWWVPPGEELTAHYASFEKNPAHAFKHHVNRDPSKASGVVKKAFWNPRMHRVELLVSVDNDKDPEWVKRASDGEFVPVSMGCFLAGAKVTLADGTQKKIEDVAVGDEVVTHLGRVRQVRETHKREYRGDVYSIHAEAHPVIHATSEHPFWTTARDTVKEPHRCGAGERWRTDACVIGDWTHAECLDNQMLLNPISSVESEPPFTHESTAFARLLGYYIADGHIIWRNDVPYAIELTTNINNAIHTEINALCARFGTRNAPWSFERKNSAAARGIMICDERLAALCHEHGGVYAKHKRLSRAVMQWPIALQRELFGAYANGDGCGRDGWLKVSTASDALASQWVRLLPRLGILASCNQLTHKSGSGFSTVDTYEWVIHIGAQWASKLRDTCAKVTPYDVRAKKESRKIINEYVVTPIREITVQYLEVDVYNLEVEEDESYLIEGLAVHNCRIKRDVCARCGNEAPTRADYCDHVKFAMNQVDANGFKDYVHNPSPDFFDISRVFRPADRTGYTLKKVAYVHEVHLSADLGAASETLGLKSGASQKLSDIDKVIRAEPLASSTLTPDERSFIVKFRDHVGPKLATSENIDVDQLQAYPLGEILRSAASHGVVFKDAEFIALASTKLAGYALALPPILVQKVAAAGRWALAAFAEHPELLDEVINSGALEASKTAEALSPLFVMIREKRAYVGEMLYRRLVPEGTGFRADGAATTDMLHTRYGVTTRGAAIDAQDAVTRAHIGKVLGGTGLLLGGYKALTAFPWMRKFKVPLALGAGALSASTLGKRPGGTIRTDEGYDIPDITELSAKTASREAIIHLIECAQNTSRAVNFSGIKMAADVCLDDVARIIGNIIMA